MSGHYITQEEEDFEEIYYKVKLYMNTGVTFGLSEKEFLNSSIDNLLKYIEDLKANVASLEDEVFNYEEELGELQEDMASDR